MNQLEKRSYDLKEFRAVDNIDGEKIIEGHAAVFEQQTDICGLFFEVIDKDAFKETSFQDVPLFANHDMGQIPLARSRQGEGNSTMILSIDEVGLAISAKLDVENNPAAKTLYSAVSRGDIAGMSFCFSTEDEEWQNLNSKMPTRRIKKISRVYEVSAVVFPAYEGTDVHARAKSTLESAKRALNKAKEQPSSDDTAELELYKLKNRILGGI